MIMYSEPFRDNWINVFDSPKPYHLIHNCLVDFETGLVHKDKKIAWETANENMAWDGGYITGDPRWADRIARQALIAERMTKMQDYFDHRIENSRDIPHYKGQTALHLLHPFGRYVYGHFYDTMQKLSIVEREHLKFDSLLLSKGHEINDFERHLSVLNLDKVNRITNDGGLARFDRLIFVMPVAHPSTFTIDAYLYCRRKYYDYFKVPAEIPAREKIFLTRRPGAYRRVLKNTEEVERALAAEGVRVFDGSEPLQSIIHGFSGASHISGVHGALWMNNIFGHQAARYLEFCPRSRPVRNFAHQYKLCGSYDYQLVDDEAHDISLDIPTLINFFAS